MLEVVSWYIIALVTHILDCYVFAKLVREKILIDLKTVLIIIFFSLVDYIVGISFSGIIKMIFTNIITYTILKLIFNKSVSKTIVATIFIFLGYVVADIIMSLIFIVIFKLDSQFFIKNYSGFILINISDFILYICIFNIKKVVKYISKIMTWYDEIKKVSLIINSIIIMILCYVILYPFSFNKIFINYQLLALCIFLGILIFVIGFFNEKSSNNQLVKKYDNLLDYVKDYEVEVVEKGKAIHEHKNQLAVIDGMIPEKDKKLTELKKYVSEKLEKVSKLDDNIWLEKLTNLPMGGIKGLVYLKIKKMLENNISIFVEIDDNLKTKSKWNKVNNNLEDYTRILGVYLDNAIEAAIESKDKQIVLEFIDNKDDIEFILSNTYKGNISFDIIDKEKYSTKGKGRGYGLSLVKDIVEKNNYIKQSREINGKFYVQKLCIKK